MKGKFLFSSNSDALDSIKDGKKQDIRDKKNQTKRI